nr:hypothetical protein [Caldilineaceae bacterium]
MQLDWQPAEMAKDAFVPSVEAFCPDPFTETSFKMQAPQGKIGGNRYSFAFVVVTAIFITCLVTANITAVKLIEIAG